MSHLLTIPAYREAYMAAKPFAVKIARHRVEAGKCRAVNEAHEVTLWQDAIAHAAVSRAKPVAEIAAPHLRGIRQSEQHRHSRRAAA